MNGWQILGVMLGIFFLGMAAIGIPYGITIPLYASITLICSVVCIVVGIAKDYLEGDL